MMWLQLWTMDLKDNRGTQSTSITPNYQRGIGFHKKMFLPVAREGGLSLGAQELCYQFVDYREERFATPARSQGRGIPALGRNTPRLLTWASINARSIYGREKTLAG